MHNKVIIIVYYTKMAVDKNMYIKYMLTESLFKWKL